MNRRDDPPPGNPRKAPKTATKVRADRLLVERGQADSEAQAGALIMSGKVRLLTSEGGVRRIDKAGESVPSAAILEVEGNKEPYVSRGGRKLAAALDAFQLPIAGKVCLDVGVSTGGFTDCLLQRGAARVHAVDVGYGQIAWTLRNDPRVKLYERTNARTLAPGFFGEPVDLIVIDVSFISIGMLLAGVVPELSASGSMVALVKPQFELPRELVPGGVVRDPEARRRAVTMVVAAASEHGLRIQGELESPVPGPEGNLEHLVWLAREPT